MIRAVPVIFTLISALLAGCSTEQSKQTPSNEQLQQRAYEDAEDAERMFPKETAHKIYDAHLAAKKAGRPSHELVLPVLCDGSEPRVSPAFIFTFHPQRRTGEAIDDAALLRRKSIQQAIDYFKSNFFFVAAGNGNPGSRNFDISYVEQYIPMSETLTSLFENYTFILPGKITKMLWKDSGFFHNGRDYNGPQGETPSDSLRDRVLLWKIVLADGTTMTTTPTESGDIKIRVQLSLDLICRSIVPTSQLKAR